MYGKKIILTACALLWAPATPAADFSGARALDFTRRAVEFGPRPPGSPSLAKLRAYIAGQLRSFGAEVTEDAFTAQTPRGPVAMHNIIARLAGSSGHAVVLTGHYDTKWMPNIQFVGANDGGASAGFLLEMARALADRKRVHDIILVWFDGEEAFGEWSDTDGIYGSRHLAARWAAEGKLARIAALINFDMIADANLGILQEQYSSGRLNALIQQSAAALGLGKFFLSSGGAIEDDHVPFVRRGVNAADLIDFDYPPWHTAADTMDKLSAASFQVVGTVTMEVLRRLEAGR